MTKANTKSTVLRLHNNFRAFTSNTKEWTTDKWWERMVKTFIKDLEKGFDIRAKDVNAIRKQEALHGMKEIEEERAFYLDRI